ncbi:MAG: hypothetical protein HY538_03605 [Deltaproteobacteria bacterium]|nr:hypothetical protein [Deltaproteobacteria bacterium]
MITKAEALRYHAGRRPGKISIAPTKSLATQRDLSLAYTPGVAEPCLEIANDPSLSFKYTSKGNLVAVITNGTAVLGLGNIGPLAAKPVMEGKAVLFKLFADIDVFDIELQSADPDSLIQIVQALEPTFGGINLEDIKAPECFTIEEELRKKLKIPVFHDDQHGTAIITTAAMLNALEVVHKKIQDVRVVFSGAGAAGIACAKMLVSFGLPKGNIVLCDRKGVVYHGRPGGEKYRDEFAQKTKIRSLEEAMKGADVFIGVSSKGLVTSEMLRSMNERPIVFALANPDPEISYPEAILVRKDVVMGTGRSDFPNQVNNVLGFPGIFRGALDVGASTINEEMKMAAAKSLSALAREPVPQEVREAYQGAQLEFGPEYIIPKPLDTRVVSWVAPAVAQAAVESKVARTTVAPYDTYRVALEKRLKERILLSSEEGMEEEVEE